MFSNSTSDLSLIMPKSAYKNKNIHHHASMRSSTKSIENIFAAESSKITPTKLSSKKAMSMENLDNHTDDEIIDEANCYKTISKPVSVQNRHPLLNMSRAQSVEHLMSTPIPLPYFSPLTAPIATIERRISFNEDNRQKSIANILENRKKNISKLRGLVIPDKVPENDLQNEHKVFDLPVIRSKECELITRVTNKDTSFQCMKARENLKEIESPPIKARSVFEKVC